MRGLHAPSLGGWRSFGGICICADRRAAERSAAARGDSRVLRVSSVFVRGTERARPRSGGGKVLLRFVEIR